MVRYCWEAGIRACFRSLLPVVNCLRLRPSMLLAERSSTIGRRFFRAGTSCGLARQVSRGGAVLATETNALYAPAPNGTRKGYLLWLRGGTLVAQEIDTATLELSGVPHPLADPVARIGPSAQMQVSVSAAGILLYLSSSPLRQF